MAKIQRKTQKIFGQNASNDQLAAFGSMAVGAPIYTDDIEALQTEKYEEGWKTAVVADNAPFMEEMNGVQYGLSKQIAYILQQGIPEYDDGTTYYQNSWCQVNGTFYQSLTDDNIGNNPASSSTNWKPWKFIDIATDEEIAAGESENTAVTPKQLQESINNAIIGALSYQGTWNADGQTDYSSIQLPVKAGYVYYVEGTATIGDIDWETGDFLLVNSDVNAGGSLTDVIRLDHTFSGGGNTNNPFSFGMSFYCPYELNNISCLKSNSQWNLGSSYPDLFEWIQKNLNNGIENFKSDKAYAFSGNGLNVWFPVRNPIVGATGYDTTNGMPIGNVTAVDGDNVTINGTVVTYNGNGNAGESLFTDFDFIVKGNEFRLPLLNGSETLPSSRYDDLVSVQKGETFKAPANGWYNWSGTLPPSTRIAWLNETSGSLETGVGASFTMGSGAIMPVKRGDIVRFLCDGEFTNYKAYFVYAKGNGNLYYYAGNNPVNKEDIDLGAITESLTNKLDIAGGTMTGDLTFNKDISINYEMPEYVSGGTSSVNVHRKILTTFSNNGIRKSAVESSILTDGRHYITIGEKKSDEENTYANIQVGFDINGNKFSYVHTPPDNDNSTQIATTAFVNKAVDGQWIPLSVTIAENVTYTTSSTTTTTSINLSSYLPKDDYIYEVLFTGAAVTGATSGNFSRLSIAGMGYDWVEVCANTTRANSTVASRGNAIIPINSARTVKVYVWANISGTYSLYLRGYRRVGNNK